ncbi:MAG: pyrimidine dimer DNA glycosylase/endonuclease V [Nitrososphaeraceae archaeon]
MRIWDIPANKLCTKHVLGDHCELHGLWNILTQNKSGYSRHPETLRWKGKLAALYLRHEELVAEMKKRNYQHKSDLNRVFATGRSIQEKFVDSYDEQLEILKDKGCKCKIT